MSDRATHVVEHIHLPGILEKLHWVRKEVGSQFRKPVIQVQLALYSVEIHRPKNRNLHFFALANEHIPSHEAGSFVLTLKTQSS